MRRIAFVAAAVGAVVAVIIGLGPWSPGERDAADAAAPAAAEAGHPAAGTGGGESSPAPPAEASSPADPAETAQPAGAPDASSGSPAAAETGGTGAAQAERPADAGSSPVTETSGTRDEAQADAAAILRRAAAAYADVNTISAQFTQHLRNPLLRTDARSSGRLYQRHPDRFLMKFEDPEGDVIVSDGRYFWVYYPSADSLQVMRAPAGAQGSSGVDLRSQFVGDPLERFDATLEGREAVGGRDAHVLTLVPKRPAGYERLRIWVDERDHLVRRFEITEENGNVRLIELSGLEINRSLGDELFRFTPPPNARIVERG